MEVVVRDKLMRDWNLNSDAVGGSGGEVRSKCQTECKLISPPWRSLVG